MIKNRKIYIVLITIICMKQTFTCSLDEETVAKIREHARVSSFRNKSHLVEEAVLKFLGEKG